MDIVDSLRREFEILNEKMDLVFKLLPKDSSDIRTYDLLNKQRWEIDYEEK
jgi:hypothetical protein